MKPFYRESGERCLVREREGLLRFAPLRLVMAFPHGEESVASDPTHLEVRTTCTTPVLH